MLALPIRVKHARVAKLNVSLANLHVELSGLHIVAELKTRELVAERLEAELGLLQTKVEEALAALLQREKDAEDRRKSAGATPKAAGPKVPQTAPPKQGFFAKLTVGALDKVSASVSDVHIRIESVGEQGLDERHPFSLGVTLESLSLQSLDPSGEKTVEVRGDSEYFLRKIANLEGLAVYFNSDHERSVLNDIVADADHIARYIPREIREFGPPTLDDHGNEVSLLDEHWAELSEIYERELAAAALGDSQYILSPLSGTCVVVINDFYVGDQPETPRAELLRMLTESGFAARWREEVYLALPGGEDEYDQFQDGIVEYFVAQYMGRDRNEKRLRRSTLKNWLTGILVSHQEAYLLNLLQEFVEECASCTAPAIAVTAKLDNLSIALSDSQYRDLMLVVSLVGTGPMPPSPPNVAAPETVPECVMEYKRLWKRKIVAARERKKVAAHKKRRERRREHYEMPSEDDIEHLRERRTREVEARDVELALQLVLERTLIEQHAEVTLLDDPEEAFSSVAVEREAREEKASRGFEHRLDGSTTRSDHTDDDDSLSESSVASADDEAPAWGGGAGAAARSETSSLDGSSMSDGAFATARTGGDGNVDTARSADEEAFATARTGGSELREFDAAADLAALRPYYKLAQLRKEAEEDRWERTPRESAVSGGAGGQGLLSRVASLFFGSGGDDGDEIDNAFAAGGAGSPGASLLAGTGGHSIAALAASHNMSIGVTLVEGHIRLMEAQVSHQELRHVDGLDADSFGASAVGTTGGSDTSHAAGTTSVSQRRGKRRTSEWLFGVSLATEAEEEVDSTARYATTLVELNLADWRVTYDQWYLDQKQEKSKMEIKVRLQTLSVNDLVTQPGSQLQLIGRRSQAASGDALLSERSRTFLAKASQDAPLVDLDIVLGKPGTLGKPDTDLSIVGQTQALDIKVSLPCIGRVLCIFDPAPTVDMQAYQDAMMQYAGNIVEAIHLRVEDVLSAAPMELDVTLRSPRVILPQTPNCDDTMQLVLDLGVCHVQTDMTPHGHDIERDPRCVYERMDLSIHGIQAYFVDGDPFEPTDGPLGEFAGGSEPGNLILPFDVSVQLYMSKIENRALHSMQVHASLPELHVVVSTEKYSRLVDWIAAISESAALAFPAASVADPADSRSLLHSDDSYSTSTVTEDDLQSEAAGMIVKAKVGKLILAMGFSAGAARRAKLDVDVIARRASRFDIFGRRPSFAHRTGHGGAGAPKSREGSHTRSVRPVSDFSEWDYEPLLGRGSVPITAVELSNVAVVYSASVTRMDVDARIGGLRLRDLLRYKHAGFLAVARGTLDDVAESPIPHPLEFCNLVTTSPFLGVRQAPPSTDGAQSDDNMLPPDVPLVHAVVQMGTAGPADVAIDAAVGSLTVVVNRDTIAALILFFATPRGDGDPEIPSGDVRPPASPESLAAATTAPDDGCSAELKEQVAREGVVPEPRLAVARQKCRAGETRPSVSITASLKTLAVVVNSECMNSEPSNGFSGAGYRGGIACLSLHDVFAAVTMSSADMLVSVHSKIILLDDLTKGERANVEMIGEVRDSRPGHDVVPFVTWEDAWTRAQRLASPSGWALSEPAPDAAGLAAAPSPPSRGLPSFTSDQVTSMSVASPPSVVPKLNFDSFMLSSSPGTHDESGADASLNGTTVPEDPFFALTIDVDAVIAGEPGLSIMSPAPPELALGVDVERALQDRTSAMIAFDLGMSEALPGGMEIRVILRKARIVYLARALGEIITATTDGPFMEALSFDPDNPDAPPPEPEPAPVDPTVPSLPLLWCRLESPRVVLPLNSASTERVVADFATLHACNAGAAAEMASTVEQQLSRGLTAAQGAAKQAPRAATGDDELSVSSHSTVSTSNEDNEHPTVPESAARRATVGVGDLDRFSDSDDEDSDGRDAQRPAIPNTTLDIQEHVVYEDLSLLPRSALLTDPLVPVEMLALTRTPTASKAVETSGPYRKYLRLYKENTDESGHTQLLGATAAMNRLSVVGHEVNISTYLTPYRLARYGPQDEDGRPAVEGAPDPWSGKDPSALPKFRDMLNCHALLYTREIGVLLEFQSDPTMPLLIDIDLAATQLMMNQRQYNFAITFAFHNLYEEQEVLEWVPPPPDPPMLVEDSLESEVGGVLLRVFSEELSLEVVGGESGLEPLQFAKMSGQGRRKMASASAALLHSMKFAATKKLRELTAFAISRGRAADTLVDFDAARLCRLSLSSLEFVLRTGTATSMHVRAKAAALDDTRRSAETAVHPALRRMLSVHGPMPGHKSTAQFDSDDLDEEDEAVADNHDTHDFNVVFSLWTGPNHQSERMLAAKREERQPPEPPALGSFANAPTTEYDTPDTALIMDARLTAPIIVGQPLLWDFLDWLNTPMAMYYPEEPPKPSVVFPSAACGSDDGEEDAKQGAEEVGDKVPERLFSSMVLTAQIEDGAVVLPVDVGRPDTPGLVLPLDATAWLEMSSAGQMGVRVDVVNLRAARTTEPVYQHVSHTKFHLSTKSALSLGSTHRNEVGGDTLEVLHESGGGGGGGSARFHHSRSEGHMASGSVSPTSRRRSSSGSSTDSKRKVATSKFIPVHFLPTDRSAADYLKPLDASFVFSSRSFPAFMGIRLGATATWKLRVGKKDVDLIMSAINTFLAYEEPDYSDDPVLGKEMAATNAFWEAKKTDEAVPDPQDGEQSLLVVAHLPEIDAIIVNDFAGQDVPLCTVRLKDVDALIRAWGYDAVKGYPALRASVSLALSATFFESSHAVYEPLIERWPVSVLFQMPELSAAAQRRELPQCLFAPEGLAVERDHSQQRVYPWDDWEQDREQSTRGTDNIPAAQLLKVNAPAPLDLNCTLSFLNTLLDTARLAGESGDGDVSGAESGHAGVVHLDNATEMDVEFENSPAPVNLSATSQRGSKAQAVFKTELSLREKLLTGVPIPDSASGSFVRFDAAQTLGQLWKNVTLLGSAMIRNHLTNTWERRHLVLDSENVKNRFLYVFRRRFTPLRRTTEDEAQSHTGTDEPAWLRGADPTEYVRYDLAKLFVGVPLNSNLAFLHSPTTYVVGLFPSSLVAEKPSWYNPSAKKVTLPDLHHTLAFRRSRSARSRRDLRASQSGRSFDRSPASTECLPQRFATGSPEDAEELECLRAAQEAAQQAALPGCEVPEGTLELCFPTLHDWECWYQSLLCGVRGIDFRQAAPAGGGGAGSSSSASLLHPDLLSSVTPAREKLERAAKLAAGTYAGTREGSPLLSKRWERRGFVSALGVPIGPGVGVRGSSAHDMPDTWTKAKYDLRNVAGLLIDHIPATDVAAESHSHRRHFSGTASFLQSRHRRRSTVFERRSLKPNKPQKQAAESQAPVVAGFRSMATVIKSAQSTEQAHRGRTRRLREVHVGDIDSCPHLNVPLDIVGARSFQIPVPKAALRRREQRRRGHTVEKPAASGRGTRRETSWKRLQKLHSRSTMSRALPANAHKWSVVSEVSFDKGRKAIRFRSSLCLANNLAVPMLVQLLVPASYPGTSVAPSVTDGGAEETKDGSADDGSADPAKVSLDADGGGSTAARPTPSTSGTPGATPSPGGRGRMERSTTAADKTAASTQSDGYCVLGYRRVEPGQKIYAPVEVAEGGSLRFTPLVREGEALPKSRFNPAPLPRLFAHWTDKEHNVEAEAEAAAARLPGELSFEWSSEIAHDYWASRVAARRAELIAEAGGEVADGTHHGLKLADSWTESTEYVQCKAVAGSPDSDSTFRCTAHVVSRVVMAETINGFQEGDPTTTISFVPCMRIENLLPFPVEVESVLQSSRSRLTSHTLDPADSVDCVILSTKQEVTSGRKPSGDASGDNEDEDTGPRRGAASSSHDILDVDAFEKALTAAISNGDDGLTVALRMPNYASLGWSIVGTGASDRVCGGGAMCTSILFENEDRTRNLSLSVERVFSGRKPADLAGTVANVEDAADAKLAGRDSAVTVRIFAAFWFVNRTDMILLYSDVVGKSKATTRLAAGHGEWYNGRPLEMLDKKKATKQRRGLCGGKQAKEAAEDADEQDTFAGLRGRERSRTAVELPAVVDLATDATDAPNTPARGLQFDLFSFSDPDLHEIQVKAQVTEWGSLKGVKQSLETEWSEKCSLQSVGATDGEITLEGTGNWLGDPHAPEYRDVEAVKRSLKPHERMPQLRDWEVDYSRVKCAYMLGVSIDVAPGRFRRTKVVTLTPRYVFINRCPYPVAFQQHQSDRAKLPLTPKQVLEAVVSEHGDGREREQIEAGLAQQQIDKEPQYKFTAFHWAQKPEQVSKIKRHRVNPRSIRCRLLEPEYYDGSESDGTVESGIADLQTSIWDWSAPFQLDNIGASALKLRRHLPGVDMTKLSRSSLHDSSAPGVHQSTFLNVEVQKEGAIIFVTFSYKGLEEQQNTAPYRVDNRCSVDRLLVRQAGLGPAAAEHVPCFGGSHPEPLIFALDHPGGSGTVMVQARPVGVASLLYYDNGAVGRAIAERKYEEAAARLERCALGGTEGGACAEDGNGGTDGWGSWGEGDGAGFVYCNDVRAQGTIRVGADGCGDVGAERKLFVEVVAGAATGPTKVIRVWDLPPNSKNRSIARRRRRMLKDRIREVVLGQVIGGAMLDCLERVDSTAVVARDADEFVWVQVVSGYGLPIADLNGKSDPFCVLTIEGGPRVGKKKKQQSVTIEHVDKTLEPVWGQEHVFWMGKRALKAKHEVVLKLELYDWDRYSKNDLLGEVCIKLNGPEGLKNDNEVRDRWYKLQQSASSPLRATGSVRVRLVRTHNVDAARREAARNLVEQALDEGARLLTKLQRCLASTIRKAKRSHLLQDTVTRMRRPTLRDVAADAYIDKAEPQLLRQRERTDEARESLGGAEESKGEEDSAADFFDTAEAAPTTESSHADATTATPSDFDETTSVGTSLAEDDAGSATRRCIGRQLEVAVIETDGVYLPSGASPRLYTTVRLGRSIRRTGVTSSHIELRLLQRPFGFSLAPASELDASPRNSAWPSTAAIVHNVVTDVLLKAVAPECSAVARSLRTGWRLTHVNNVNVSGKTFDAAIWTVNTAIVTSIKREAGQPANSDDSESPQLEVASDAAVWAHNVLSAAKDPAQRERGGKMPYSKSLRLRFEAPDRVDELPHAVQWRQVLNFGVDATNEAAPSNPEVPEPVGVEALAPAEDRCVVVSVFARRPGADRADEQVLHGLPLKKAPDVPVEGEETAAATADAVADDAATTARATGLLPLHYFIGNSGEVMRGSRNPFGAIDRTDLLVGRRSLSAPEPGEIVDAWFALRSSTRPRDGKGAAGDGARDVPRVRVYMRWIPLYAADEDVQELKLDLKLKGLGLSVCDAAPQELLYLAVRDISAAYSRSAAGREVNNLSIGVLQINNQLPDADMPILLGPVYKTAEEALVPTLQVAIIQDPHKDITYYTYVSVLLQQLAIQSDDDFLFRVLQFIYGLHIYDAAEEVDDRGDASSGSSDESGSDSDGSAPVSRTEHQSRDHLSFIVEETDSVGAAGTLAPIDSQRSDELVSDDDDTVAAVVSDLMQTPTRRARSLGVRTYRKARKDLFESTLLARRTSPATSAPVEEKSIYISVLHLQPIAVDITFSMSHDSEMLKSALAGDTVTGSVLATVVEAFSAMLANINDAPIRLGEYRSFHVYESPSMLQTRIINHYWGIIQMQLFKVLGSVQFLGNPWGLYQSLHTNLQTFFYEPAKGVLESPSEFGAGLYRGTTGLLKTSVAVLDSAGMFVNTISKGLHTIESRLDDDGKMGKKGKAQKGKRKPAGKRRRGQGREVGSDFKEGAVGFGASLWEGVSGLVMQPIRGARTGGAKGLFCGVGKGVAGVLVRPAAGLLDLIVATMHEGSNIAAASDKAPVVLRTRPPRYIGDDGMLMPYAEREAHGHSLLLKLNARGHARGEGYIYHGPAQSYEKVNRGQEKAVTEMLNVEQDDGPGAAARGAATQPLPGQVVKHGSAAAAATKRNRAARVTRRRSKRTNGVAFKTAGDGSTSSGPSATVEVGGPAARGCILLVTSHGVRVLDANTLNSVYHASFPRVASREKASASAAVKDVFDKFALTATGMASDAVTSLASAASGAASSIAKAGRRVSTFGDDLAPLVRASRQLAADPQDWVERYEGAIAVIPDEHNRTTKSVVCLTTPDEAKRMEIAIVAAVYARASPPLDPDDDRHRTHNLRRKLFRLEVQTQWHDRERALRDARRAKIEQEGARLRAQEERVKREALERQRCDAILGISGVGVRNSTEPRSHDAWFGVRVNTTDGVRTASVAYNQLQALFSVIPPAWIIKKATGVDEIAAQGQTDVPIVYPLPPPPRRKQFTSPELTKDVTRALHSLVTAVQADCRLRPTAREGAQIREVLGRLLDLNNAVFNPRRAAAGQDRRR